MFRTYYVLAHFTNILPISHNGTKLAPCFSLFMIRKQRSYREKVKVTGMSYERTETRTPNQY